MTALLHPTRLGRNPSSSGHQARSSSSAAATAAGGRPMRRARRLCRAFGGSRDAAAAADTVAPTQWKGPTVDWSRYHLQVLFVDSSDVLRAKLAAAYMEQVAGWNGYSRCLLASTAGLHAAGARGQWDLTVQAGLVGRAQLLGLPWRLFARPPEPFEPRDLDAHDVVVAVDSATREGILSRVDAAYRAHYEDKVRLLSEYAQQQPLADAEVYAVGGLALLPRKMSLQLRRDLPQLRRVVDMPRPSLSDGAGGAGAGGGDAWDTCTRAAMLGAAGLVRFLVDAYPPDLPEYDPL